MRNESVPPPVSPEQPPLAPYDPPEPAPQAIAWARALKVVTGDMPRQTAALIRSGALEKRRRPH